MKLIILRQEQTESFKAEMQEAFQAGYETYYGHTDQQILPSGDIDQSLECNRSIAFEALSNGERLGGAIITIGEDGISGELDFLYVKVGSQNQGVASFIWKTIEASYPDVKTWETYTPYFDKRNIHFYVNKCGFKIVEFYTEHHKDPNYLEPEGNDPMEDGFFKFEKVISL